MKVESTNHQWMSNPEDSYAELGCFFVVNLNYINSGVHGDLRRHKAHVYCNGSALLYQLILWLFTYSMLWNIPRSPPTHKPCTLASSPVPAGPNGMIGQLQTRVYYPSMLVGRPTRYRQTIQLNHGALWLCLYEPVIDKNTQFYDCNSDAEAVQPLSGPVLCLINCPFLWNPIPLRQENISIMSKQTCQHSNEVMGHVGTRL